MALKVYTTFHGALPSDCLVSYPGHYLEKLIPLCRDAVSTFCSPSRLGHRFFLYHYYYYYYFTYMIYLMVSHWSLSDNKFLQVSRTLVFWLIFIVLSFGWCPLVLLFPSHPVPLSIIWWLIECTNYNWYHYHFHVPQLFQFSSNILVLTFLFAFFYNYYYYYSLRVFHISVNWWSFTKVRVTASLLKSPGLFSVFWPISIV